MNVSEGQGSCLLYDNLKMSQYMIGICIVPRIIFVLFYSLSALASRSSAIKDEMSEDDEEFDDPKDEEEPSEAE